MKFGLLMESAQTHQKMAEAHLEKLRAHTQELDGVVREEIRRTLIEELQELTDGERARDAGSARHETRGQHARAFLERRQCRAVYGHSKRHSALGSAVGARNRHIES